MDHFFQDQLQDDFPIFWYEPVPVNQSAFVPYTNTPIINQLGSNNSVNVSSSGNMNKRMVEFLRRSWPVRTETQEPERDRCFRHMMNERMRRERQRNSYLALHSVLPLGTKNDKKSIVQMAETRIEELQSYKEVLERRNNELLTNLAAIEEEKVGRTKIRVRVDNPTSGVDSMVEVLKLLKNLGTKTKSIQSKFTDKELLAVVDIETEIDAGEVEKAVHTRLQEVERKLHG